jgi:hypothetical protein
LFLTKLINGGNLPSAQSHFDEDHITDVDTENQFFADYFYNYGIHNEVKREELKQIFGDQKVNLITCNANTTSILLRFHQMGTKTFDQTPRP